jgi:hypothetical protein
VSAEISFSNPRSETTRFESGLDTGRFPPGRSRLNPPSGSSSEAASRTAPEEFRVIPADCRAVSAAAHEISPRATP